MWMGCISALNISVSTVPHYSYRPCMTMNNLQKRLPEHSMEHNILHTEHEKRKLNLQIVLIRAIKVVWKTLNVLKNTKCCKSKMVCMGYPSVYLITWSKGSCGVYLPTWSKGSCGVYLTTWSKGSCGVYLTTWSKWSCGVYLTTWSKGSCGV